MFPDSIPWSAYEDEQRGAEHDPVPREWREAVRLDVLQPPLHRDECDQRGHDEADRKIAPALAGERWGDLAIGFVVSALVAFIAVKWRLQYIQTHRFTPFAWYRIVLGAALLVFVR